jgi:hypothetical protein
MVHSRKILGTVAKHLSRNTVYIALDKSAGIHRQAAPYSPSTIRKRIFDNDVIEPSRLSNQQPKPRHNGRIGPAVGKLIWRLTKRS